MFIVMMRGCIWLQKYIVMSQKWLKRVDPSSPAPLLSTHPLIFEVFTAASPQSSVKINEIHVNILEHTNLYRLRLGRDVMSFFCDLYIPCILDLVHPAFVHHRTQRAFEMQRFLRAGYSMEEVERR